MNAILWQPKALRQLRKLPGAANIEIRAAVSLELVDLTQVRDVKALTKHAYGFRLRAGNHRVFFDFDGVVRVVSIEELKKRDERTY